MANTIAGAFKGRDNNFNLIRFLAASAVLVDHSFALVPSELAAASPIDLPSRSAAGPSMCSSSSRAFSSPAAS